jgi:tetratricopeptide (TPR) repeat protein
MGYDETVAAFRRGDNAAAERLARVDLERAIAAGDRTAHVDALCMLSRTALRDGRLDDVETHARAAYEAAGEETRLQRMPIHMRAVAARMAGQHDEARRLYRQSINLNEQLGESRMAAVEHRNLAYVEIHAGDVDEARSLIVESRRRFSGMDTPSMAPYLVFDDATMAALEGDLATARTKLDAAQSLFAEQGVVPDPDDAAEIAALRRRLDAPTRD